MSDGKLHFLPFALNWRWNTLWTLVFSLLQLIVPRIKIVGTSNKNLKKKSKIKGKINGNSTDATYENFWCHFFRWILLLLLLIYTEKEWIGIVYWYFIGHSNCGARCACLQGILGKVAGVGWTCKHNYSISSGCFFDRRAPSTQAAVTKLDNCQSPF